MGHANKDLLVACEKARRAGNDAEWKRLAAEVEKTQDECPHPMADRAEQIANKDANNDRVKKGQKIVWCKRCSKLLSPPKKVVYIEAKM